MAVRRERSYYDDTEKKKALAGRRGNLVGKEKPRESQGTSRALKITKSDKP